MKRLYSALPGIVVALVVLIVAWVARAGDGRRSLADADAALIRGDKVEAIAAARAAAEARCPGCSAPENGYAKLYAIGRDAETKGDDPTALVAWRAVRAASLSATWLEASEPRRERADAEIARLSHRIDAMTAATGANASPAATEERLKAVLAPNPLPPTMIFVVLAVGAVLLIAGAIRAVRALNAANIALAVSGVAVAIVAVLAF